MAAEIGLSLVGKITDLLIQPIQRELGYLLCFNNNIQMLETRLVELKATRNDVQGREDAEKRIRKTLGECAELWIQDANGKITEAEKVINDKADLQKGCFSIKLCPNIRLRFSLGRKGKKLSLVLNDLLQRGGNLPHTGHALPIPSINMSDYNGDACDFDSRSQIMEDIIEMLRGEETMLIGICGMGGIGKTTFAKQVLQKVKDFHKNLFDIQVITIVSSNPNFNTIQQEVAEMLGSSLKEIESEILKAQHLRNAFCNKKVVVLLDDVWEKFDLNAKGFVTKSDIGYCCKIIYTSRIQGLWSGERTITKKEISLDLLSSEEASDLFRRKVYLNDNDIDFHLKNEIARKIVDECKGLPLALEVVGGALIDNSKHEWEDMLFQLRNHSQDQHNDKINKVLETSYHFLENHNSKFLFLLCCLFQEDEQIHIERLYRYVAGLQLFKDINDIKHIRDRVYTLVDNLIRRNLLIKVEALDRGERVVMMHDVVRDVGISIAKQQENSFSFLVCDGVNELENVIDQHTKMTSILFLKKDLKVPDMIEVKGSKLELLRLDSSRVYQSNTKISGNFFQGADNLKVLDIVGGVISEFPYSSSFPYLAKLKMLSLGKLKITTNLSFIQHLSCLETLSLRWSTIKALPNEVSELTNLKLLDLTGCQCFISNGILSRLTNLQELYLWHSFKNWRQSTDGDNKAADLVELDFLHKLWRLELEVPNIEQVPRGIRLFSSSTLLKQFKISIGGGEEYIEFESGERQLWLKNFKNNTSFIHELGFLIEKGITNLYLWDNYVMWEKMHLNRFLSLKDIVFKHCGPLFPQSSLQISDIEEINGFGRCLRRIEMYECNQTRHLCSASISRHLKNLQVLVLKNCEMMQEVVNICDETEQLEKIEFNALEALEIYELSVLEYFCKGIKEIHFLRLRSLKLKGLEKFIFPSKLEIPCLEELSIKSIPNIETLCNIVAPSLKELKIGNCDNIIYVFSKSSMTKSISHLKTLTIKNCKMLKGVVRVSTDVEEEWEKSIQFSNLKTLHFCLLDQLLSFVVAVNKLDKDEEKPQHALFHHDDQVSFPCLQELIINALPKISYIVGRKGRRSHLEEVDGDDTKRQQIILLSIFPILEKLELYNLNNLIHIYENNHPGLGVLLFENLICLDIANCDKVRYLFSENIGRVASKHLKSLYICLCPMMEVVMKNEEELIEDDDDKAGGKIICLENSHFFPLLYELRLENLSSLRSFCDIAYTWSLPSLEDLTVSDCPKLETLCPGYLNSPRLLIFRNNFGAIHGNRDINIAFVPYWNVDLNSAFGAYGNCDINSAVHRLFIKTQNDELVHEENTWMEIMI